jgi:uncharacterized phage protein (predicted DNA packaging)
MALLDDVKAVLRVSDDNKDTEIGDLIAAAQTDLALAGVTPSMTTLDPPDPLIKQAIVLYAKANYGWDNQEAPRFQESYNLLKASLTLSADYTDYTPTPGSETENTFMDNVATDWGDQ